MKYFSIYFTDNFGQQLCEKLQRIKGQGSGEKGQRNDTIRRLTFIILQYSLKMYIFINI